MATSAPQPFSAASRSLPGAARSRTEALYEEYARTVGGLCRALLRNRTEAEDATQQVFLSAHRALLNGSAPREPAAWLATIARNECWGRISARMREPLPDADVEVEVASTLPDPLAEAIRNADLAALWRAIRELPVQQREALLLREFGGLSYDELAAALAVSTPAVESLLFRARRGVRVKLQAGYAALSGVSWVDALLRLLSGSGAAAPIAAKAVALGVGAAAVTGGAVIAPQVVRSHQHHVTHVRMVHQAAPHTTFTPAAISQPVVQRSETATTDGRDTRRDGRGDSQPESQVTTETPTTTTSGSDQSDGGAVQQPAPVTTFPTADGGSSSGDGGGGGQSPTSLDGGSSGSSSGSGGGGGGLDGDSGSTLDG